MKELLTGKCKEDFERWVDGRYTYLQLYVEFYNNGGLNFYTEIPFISQYGVYLEFFDSVGIVCDVQPVLDYNSKSYTRIKYFITNVNELNNEDIDYNGTNYKSRQEAQQQAIIKANSIYNERQ